MTNLERWGVENPSQSELVKDLKKKTVLNNWGVDNPFQSEIIKEKSRTTNFKNFGVDHPMRSEIIKNKVRNSVLERWGVDNFTKSKEYREIMFNKWRSGLIKTNLNSDPRYHSYIGLGIHSLYCDNGCDHTYETNSHLYHSRIGLNNKQCTICKPVNSTHSFKELELLEFIKSIYDGVIISSYRQGLEIEYLSTGS
jgi:hypothetical protein